MTDTNTTGTNGNGTETEKEKSAVLKLVARHNQEKQGKPAMGKAAKDLTDKFKLLIAARDKAAKALEAAQKELNAHSEGMVVAFGDRKLRVNGVLYFPASRGETVFYRAMGTPNPEDVIDA